MSELIEKFNNTSITWEMDKNKVWWKQADKYYCNEMVEGEICMTEEFLEPEQKIEASNELQEDKKSSDEEDYEFELTDSM
uniref:Uncharacterized protein n=1 Tax=Romanomermis culicivorax TaxID=13658 RepID=A0A915HW19_ROMCU